MTIHAECPNKKIKSKVLSGNELTFKNMSAAKSGLLVFIVSSTGDGDVPDNSSTFFKDLKKQVTPGHLKGVQYTLLGLGDSNYTSFMQVPRDFQRKFKELGAEVFYECVEADEVDGLDDITDSWVDGLWEPLKKAVNGEAAKDSTVAPQAKSQTKSASSAREETTKPVEFSIPQKLCNLDMEGKLAEGIPALPACRIQIEWEKDEAVVNTVVNCEKSDPQESQLSYRSPDGDYSLEQPLWASVSDTRLMTAGWSDRRVIHVELDIEDSNMHYSPGDSLGVVTQNNEETVEALLERISVSGEKVFSVKSAESDSNQKILPHLGCPCTVNHALTHGCDLTSAPKKLLLRYLAEQCLEESEKSKLTYICSRSGKDAYKAYVLDAQASLLDILMSFPSCKPSLEGLLDLLPPLAPRMYSVTTCEQSHSGRVQFAFTLAKFTNPYGDRQGVATSWMDGLLTPMLQGKERATVRLPVFWRSGGVFGPPQDLTKPWILIGPGTGVAPFRGFLEARRISMKDFTGCAGQCWLFFGCRKRDEDYLYNQDLEGFVEDGTLTKLELAFSREQAEKVYVQHRMKEHAEALHELIFKKEGYVFVCGDGQDMAKAVHSCLSEILQEHGKMTEREAADKLMELTKGKRYIRDVWS